MLVEVQGDLLENLSLNHTNHTAKYAVMQVDMRQSQYNTKIIPYHELNVWIASALLKAHLWRYDNRSQFVLLVVAGNVKAYLTMS